MKFKTKHDWYFTLVIVTMFVLLLAVIIAYGITFGTDTLFYVMICVYFAFLLLYFDFYFWCFYVLEEDGIAITMGFLNFKIKYNSIKNIEEVRNLKFSFATSHDRVLLSYGDEKKKWTKVFVSPKNKQEFINEIKQRCKSLK